MGINYSAKYNIDISMCIDGSESMGRYMDSVKKTALNFCRNLADKFTARDRDIDQLRVRLIVFRDYLADGENAMRVTDFFTLPAENAKFAQAVNSITANGGGDDLEDGLEALAYAIRSDWNNTGRKKRHVVVLWTDDGAHELGFGKRAPNYPNGMPKDFRELSAWWGVGHGGSMMDRRAKRLLIFAPPKEPWTTIAKTWDYAIHYPAAAGEGLKEKEYNDIILSCLIAG